MHTGATLVTRASLLTAGRRGSMILVRPTMPVRAVVRKQSAGPFGCQALNLRAGPVSWQ